jgi:hypothetical protein
VLPKDIAKTHWQSVLDAKPYLHVSENTIRVEFFSDVKAGEKFASQVATHGDTHIPDELYVRKAAYE